MKIFIVLIFFILCFDNVLTKPPETHAKLHASDFASLFFSRDNNLEIGIFKALYEKKKDYRIWYPDLCAYDDSHPDTIKNLLNLWRTLYFKHINMVAGSIEKCSWCACGFTSNEDRLVLLLRIFDDLCQAIKEQPGKDFFSEKLVITSLASGGCLFELLLVTGLFTFGFRNIELNLIDHQFKDAKMKENKEEAFNQELKQLGLDDRSLKLNFYTNGYDYIFKIINEKAQKSDIIFGTDYGNSFIEDSPSKNMLKLSNELEEEVVSLLFSPKSNNMCSIFVTTNSSVAGVITFLKEIEPAEKNGFFNKATFYKEKILTHFPDYKVFIGEFSPQTFDDLVTCAGKPRAITYQIQKYGLRGFTQDSALSLQLNQGQSELYTEYTLQFKLLGLSYKLQSLKEKLLELGKQLTQLQKNL